MIRVGQKERITQNRIVQFFPEELAYCCLGDWRDRAGNRDVEVNILSRWLKHRGVNDAINTRIIRQLDESAALGEGMNC